MAFADCDARWVVVDVLCRGVDFWVEGVEDMPPGVALRFRGAISEECGGCKGLGRCMGSDNYCMRPNMSKSRELGPIPGFGDQLRSASTS